ncbi:hypothetical protein AALO_G00207140 [Alosa alosa]|uniref:Cadherin domain-containing protein n=1 Tax=Alosa alosa TaxID=278164 RepID=A0AAV6G8Z8_9TELE|nr:hypothetical protein AALO_G00207140 [Alosa alosa]
MAAADYCSAAPDNPGRERQRAAVRANRVPRQCESTLLQPLCSTQPSESAKLTSRWTQESLPASASRPSLPQLPSPWDGAEVGGVRVLGVNDPRPPSSRQPMRPASRRPPWDPGHAGSLPWQRGGERPPGGSRPVVINTRDEDSSPSNRQVTYHITGGDRAGVFGLGLVQGEWTLYVRNSLDREQQDHYIINVTATDGLHASIVSVDVTVTDANDNSPVCEQALYSLSVLEDVKVGSVLLRVRATDADLDSYAQIRYTLTGDGAHNFSLHPHTGELKTAVELDRETTSQYTLVAVATDGGGLSCSAQVSITLLDVNDNAPQLGQSELAASVYENTPTKALITRIQAMDPDLGAGGRVLFSLLDSEGVFALDAESGVLSLERPLDREQRSAWRVCVLASDQGVPPLSARANLTVSVLDVNDNPPVFERRDYLTALPEDVAVGTEVVRVYAASKDIGTNADIYYSIRHGNQLGHFSIHINTGAISVWRPLDFETCSGYFLTVEARDGGTPPLSAVTMVNINVSDVNDNAPVFSRDAYSATISEDAAIGDSVVKVTAEDMDSPLNGAVLYSIAGGDREKQFFIEPITGLIRVNKPLDRETENTPSRTSILQLSVTDKDSAHNGPPFLFRILSGNEGAEFHLDKEGLLTSNQVFRREIATEYILQVQAWDSGRPPCRRDLGGGACD